MARKKSKELRKPQVNIDALMHNARKTAGLLGFPERPSELPRGDHQTLGVIVASICKEPKWDECWCDKEKKDGGCRWCQTYQLVYGLDPTCDDHGISIDPKLREQQKMMEKKYLND